MHELGSWGGVVARISVRALAVALLGVSLGEVAAQPAAGDSNPIQTYASQGWSDADRQTFYTTSQGSRLIPYDWFKALRRLDVDAPFAGDHLQRYGYLPNDNPSNVTGLPVGFVVEKSSKKLGMTCAACHTGQLEYQKDGKTFALRLDGAPANADFQQFLLDLRDVTRATLAQSDRFDSFANVVLGAGHTAGAAASLKTTFGEWVQQFGDFMDMSLPASPWGPGRLDAFGMIFNRVAGRDLGVPGNFAKADAPVSYPFMWNASRQDHTQWNGGVPNGLYLQALIRNTGEVYGVFADFKPTAKNLDPLPTAIDFSDNSADFAGLQTLEEKIAALKPPKWPREVFGLDDALAAKGKPLFDQHCGACHAQRESPVSLHAWDTPVKDVGTDPKMTINAAREGETGKYVGALLPPPAEVNDRFQQRAKIGTILAASVIGSVLDEAFSPGLPDKLLKSGAWRAIHKDWGDLFAGGSFGIGLLEPARRERLHKIIEARLGNMFKKPATADAGAAYESRVLYGIWATAPYLHNGSVPNLWELLTPAKDRKPSFMVGSRLYDPKNVGYVTDQSPFKNGTFVTDPANANGNGNLGHEYGANLTPDERWAIIEYLKTL